jgi:tetratricopeptide (TPR) repeat protein
VNANDPQLFAALSHACRYCGLFDASIAAHRRARELDPQIVTTVTQTYFLSGDYRTALETSDDAFGYGTAACMAMLGRSEDAIQLLRRKEPEMTWGLGRAHLVCLRACLEGNREECVRAGDELLASAFSDPEGWFYLGRQMARAGEIDRAVRALSRSVEGGWFGFPALASDPWFEPLHGNAGFENVLTDARRRHETAKSAFEQEGGPQLLRLDPNRER